MINALSTYEHMGRKAAECRRRQDESGARFFADWALRAIPLEAAADRPAARAAYARGYHAQPVRPELWPAHCGRCGVVYPARNVHECRPAAGPQVSR